MAKKNNEKKANGNADENGFRPIDLALPEGEWWRPQDGDDTSLVVRLDRIRRGEFGEYFVTTEVDTGAVWFVNIHFMLEGLKKFVGRVVRIEYLGLDESKGRKGVHTYAAALHTGRVARAPNRPARPDENEGGESA